jgi:hypothetical protein
MNSVKRRLRVFEKEVLKGLLGCERDEVTRGWSECRNEELHELCFRSVIIIMTISIN